MDAVVLDSRSRSASIRSIHPIGAAVALFSAVLLSAAPAQAAPFEVRADLIGGFMLRMPESVAIGEDGIQGDLRSVGAGRVPVAGPVGYMGTRVSFGMAFGRHFVLRGLGFGAGGAVGPAPATLSASGGTILEAQPWNMSFWELDLIGASVRGVHRRFAWELTATTGMMAISLPVAATFGKDTVSVGTDAATVLVHVEAQGCFRVDWTKRACLFAGANVYQFGWLNGGHAGLRWEFGK